MRRLFATAFASVVITLSVVASPGVAAGGSPLDEIIALLTSRDHGLAQLKADIAAVQSEIRSTDHGLAEIKREVRIIEDAVTSTPPPSGGPMRLSSGLFALPTSAVSVDWTVLNDSATPQTITVTVYKVGVGAKSVLAPGPLTLTVAADSATHNANSVGPTGVFQVGFYYEVILETSSPNVLPTVMVWDSFGATLVAGTTISPGTWVRLQ